MFCAKGCGKTYMQGEIIKESLLAFSENRAPRDVSFHFVRVPVEDPTTLVKPVDGDVWEWDHINKRMKKAWNPVTPWMPTTTAVRNASTPSCTTPPIAAKSGSAFSKNTWTEKNYRTAHRWALTPKERYDTLKPHQWTPWFRELGRLLKEWNRRMRERLCGLPRPEPQF